MLRTVAAALCLLLLLAGCTKPSAPREPTPPPAGPPSSAEPVRYEAPRLLLDLPLGNDPDQPGGLPSRVGGVSPRGPLALAARHAGAIYLLDQAKGRVLYYEQGKLTEQFATPWVDDQVGDLRLVPEGLVVAGAYQEFTLEGGRIVDIRQQAPPAEPVIDMGKGPYLLGTDGTHRYERVMGNTGPILRRVSQAGAVLAEVPFEDRGEFIDWAITPQGGVYALVWRWGNDAIERALVYEMLPPLAEPTAAAPPTEPPAPSLFNRPVPARIRLLAPDWDPVEVTDEVDRWNLWRLLATAGPATGQMTPQHQKVARLEAGFADGSSLTMEIYPDLIAVEGSLYSVGLYPGLHRQVASLIYSRKGLAAALKDAQSASVTLADLPGVEKALSPFQRKQLSESLKDVIPVSPYSAPRPLEPPFPQYAIRLEGEGWKATLLLRGDRHLALGWEGAVAHSGRLASRVRSWLPVPELKAEEVAYLYLADRLEIGPGNDLTRWKATVVRRLLNLQPAQNAAFFKEPLTLTFYVKGEKRIVQVDAGGFTYAGKRYALPGLTDLACLQGVP